jgi:hypothetical protein
MIAVLRLLSRRGEPTRAERRTLVVLSALAIGLVGVLMLNAPRGSGAVMILGVILLLIVPLYALQEFRRNVFKRSNADERETQRRNDAYRISYRIVEFAVPLGFIVGSLLDSAITDRNWMWVYMPVLGYLIFLPYMVFAWREPDAVPD